ncbi:RNA-binding domain-containing protein [Pholiota conissans]|uniref:RNA-binding domain-containing protein n=1 Tax=Pholiota conissans TaxID=109636 RepID=A0A9P5YSV5_9AGAR|nr:RNA-binding domain-containing protein [Pholiota conissans]
MYGETATTPVDPYSDAYNAPAPASSDRDPPPARGRSRSRSPVRASANGNGNGDSRSYNRSPPPYRRRSPPPRRNQIPLAKQQPNPTNVLGVFGLSIRTQERDLEDEFSRYGRVEKVTIVYDQRQSDRSRGFGFIRMSTVEEATKCIESLNGIELNGRRIRVDYSVTDRPHASTPGEYMGHRRSNRDRDYDRRGDRDDRRDSYRDRDRDHPRRRDDRDRERDRDRDNYGRDKDWRDRRSPPPSKGGRYSPEYRRRRSYSRSPPPRGSSPPPRSNGASRDYDAPAAAPAPASTDANRW